jgi:carbamoyltransferase
MKILGISGALGHDPSAALLIDGELVAAAEEERFLRKKHAKNCLPENAVRFCLEHANLAPHQIDLVAFPFAEIPLSTPARWQYAKGYWYAPDRAFDAIFSGNRRYNRNKKIIFELMLKLGFDLEQIDFISVEHGLSHASSAYHLSGFKEKTAILGIEGKGEYASTFFGYGENGKIHKIKEFYDPDSLGGMYGALTEYLGFEMLDGEFKVMGMAPYGDPTRHDLSRILNWKNNKINLNTRLVNTIGMRRHKQDGKKFFFSPKLIDWLGPMRQGDECDEPYIHYAASIQQLLEDCVLDLTKHYLGDIIRETGRLCFAGGVALNVKLNQRLMQLPGLKELFVQPAAGDSGTAVGAATYAAALRGDTVKKLEHVYLGPQFTSEQCEKACQEHRAKPNYIKLTDVAGETAKILAAGHPVAWFQGRMEFGPRALGNRSILGDPSQPGIAERINAQIKYRERWRPFCPSITDDIAADVLSSSHPAPFMTFAFDVAPHWRERISEVVHYDGTARAQIVSEKTNPRYFALLKSLEKLRGHSVVLNTSLNRRGEPIVCTPEDALNMFFASDLEYLVMEDWLVRK